MVARGSPQISAARVHTQEDDARTASWARWKTEWMGDATAGAAMYDRATNWYASYPQATRSTQDTNDSFLHWEGPNDHVKLFYCDNGSELKAAAKPMGWRVKTSTLGIPQTKGLAERAARPLVCGIPRVEVLTLHPIGFAAALSSDPLSQ